MSFLHDIRQVTLSLARQPGFVAVTIATLALGLGLNTAVLTVAYERWTPSFGQVFVTAKVESDS